MLRIAKFTCYMVYVAICFLIAQLHDLANWLELPSYIHTLQGRDGTAMVAKYSCNILSCVTSFITIIATLHQSRSDNNVSNNVAGLIFISTL